jgi:hypothetical protein
MSFVKQNAINLKMNIEVIWYVTHMLYNALNAEILQIDDKGTVNKIFQYIHTHTYTYIKQWINEICNHLQILKDSLTFQFAWR